MAEIIQQVLDTKGVWRCVRFASGHVGVVNSQGKRILELGNYQRLAFAEHGFLRVYHRREFFIDMKNGEIYAQLPELIQFGDFEIAYICGYLCTRTRKLYEVKAIPAEAWLGKGGLYLKLPYNGEPDEPIMRRMIKGQKRYEVCLLNGDESGVYWVMALFEDHSLLVMDDAGNYYHARKHARSRKAVKEYLGKVENEADKTRVVQAVREIEAQVTDRLKMEAAKAQREADEEREKQMARLATAEPFQIGNKWGLRSRGRMVVPPIYRRVESPIGHYCVVESLSGFWGIIALDGKVEVPARYEHVALFPDGRVELTVFSGKVIFRKLGIRSEE